MTGSGKPAGIPADSRQAEGAGKPAGRRFPVIGLTGPMCAGKNRVAEILEKRGYAVTDADQVAHQALEDVRTEVLAAFGELAAERKTELLLTDGSIDRRALASIIFSDAELLARHESIIYPRINFLLDRFIDENEDRAVVINAPLLHKSPVLQRCDFVIFVDACAVIRLFRAIRRDRMPVQRILERFSAQKHLFAQYRQKNVDIQRVRNTGSIGALEKRLSRLLSLRGY